jgi:Icc-related predicted phosphoesterase
VREAVLHHAPRLVICGHIHEAHGRARLAGSEVVNASLLNERYEPAFAPVVIDL